jgi:ABC-type dipeptide/oligopeptide/nickel transport system permease subunit
MMLKSDARSLVTHSDKKTTLATPAMPQRKTRSLWSDALHRLFKNRLACAGLVLVVLFLVAAAIGPYVAPYDFLAQSPRNSLKGPSIAHWLGTDALGRDIFSRLLYGARTAAFVAFVTTSISLLLGITLGTMAGFIGGKVDGFVMWLTDVTMSIPGILLAMLVSTSLSHPVDAWFENRYNATHNSFYLNTLWIDYVLVFGTIALITWPEYARLIRGQVLSVGQMPYVEAARSVGIGTPTIMRRHIVPNAMGPVIVALTQGLGGAIVYESSLSFLGIGVQPPNASWGSMLSDSLSLWTTAPHLMFAPAITIGLIQVAFVFLGDGLNDALNPRQK